jgi:hypothetical protein
MNREAASAPSRSSRPRRRPAGCHRCGAGSSDPPRSGCEAATSPCHCRSSARGETPPSSWAMPQEACRPRVVSSPWTSWSLGARPSGSRSSPSSSKWSLRRAHGSSGDASLPGRTSCQYDIPEVVIRPWRTCRATLERYSDRHRGLIGGLDRADPLAEQAVYFGASGSARCRPLAPQADLPIGDRLCVVGTRRRLWRVLPTQSHAWRRTPHDGNGRAEQDWACPTYRQAEACPTDGLETG